MPRGLLGDRNLSLGVNTFEEMVGAIAVSPSFEERSSKREESLRTKGTGGWRKRHWHTSQLGCNQRGGMRPGGGTSEGNLGRQGFLDSEASLTPEESSE